MGRRTKLRYALPNILVKLFKIVLVGLDVGGRCEFPFFSFLYFTLLFFSLMFVVYMCACLGVYVVCMYVCMFRLRKKTYFGGREFGGRVFDRPLVDSQNTTET